ncbi:MAG TPA: hypothetical protein VFZ53_21710 [Polyangiaceae bacterium]
MFYVFLLICGAISIGIYLLFIMNLVPGAKEERLGVLEALPPDVGKWKTDEDSAEGKAAASEGLVREVRYFYYEATDRLVRQARYRNPETNEIVRTGPEEAVKRRRVRT